MNTKICPICKSPIPANAPGGFCPACLLRDAEEPAPSSRAAPSLAEVAAAFPQLEVQSLIGQGGMGFVYKVRQPSLDRVVALKILSPELGRDPAFAERFAREARVLGKLNHPNIVTVFEHGQSGGFFYLLMEYVDGVNLRQAMRAGRFTPVQALAVVPGICDALQAAHAQGVWHRDIKPENILLDARGGVKIADFGIARIVGDPARDFTLTATGGALGSAAYMAPEQHENPREVDHRADIYSLGVVIYEMLTGELPLGRFPLPSQRAAVSARIDDIVLRTLEKERELRHQSATEVKTDVQGAATAAEPAAKEPAPKGASPLSRLPRLAFWSLAFLIGGAALAGAAHVAGEFSHGSQAVGAAMSVLLTIAGAAGAFGFVGSLWALYEMKRGWMPAVGRWLLITLTIVPLAAGAIGLVAALFCDSGSEAYPQKGGMPILIGTTYGALGLVLGILFLLARPLQSASPLRRRLGRISIAVAVLAAIGCAVLAKRFDHHWPHTFWGTEATLELRDKSLVSDEQLLALLKRAAGPFVGDYELSVSNGKASVVAVTPEPNWLRSAPTHPGNCLARLRDLLPANALLYTHFQGDLVRRDSDPRFGPQRATLVILAGLGALFAALAGGRRAVWVIVGGVALHGLMFALPVWPVIDPAAPRVVDAPPLPLKLTAAELPAPDFSTPELAVASVYDARCFGRLDVAKRGVSKAFAAIIEEHPDGWDGFMSRFNGDQDARRFAVLESEHDKKDDGVAVVRGRFVPRDNERNLGEARSVVVFEDGEWKLDSLDSRYRATARVRGKTAAPRSAPTLEARIKEMEDYMSNADRVPRYRAVCRVEVRLEKGNTKALLNEALGKFCTVVPVPDVEGQFDLVVTDPDPAQTSRFANYLGEKAEELLKEREVHGTVKIIRPAERPEKPINADEGPASPQSPVK